MSSSTLLDHLNSAQLQAVTSKGTNLRVVAGAGSGKTRVLTHRIAWLLLEGISPFSILAVTFTNKAANEMRLRIEQICHVPVDRLWVGTFHGLSHRLLRLHADDAGLPKDFQILDSDDQLRLIKRIHKQMNLSESNWPVKQAQWFINKQKEEGLRAKDVVDVNDPFVRTMKTLYDEYERLCRQNGLVDFTELLLSSLDLLKNNESVRMHYQKRFSNILVDEFQDTNKIQYEWLKQFKTADNFLMAVGDDDQSIYSWRGACIENMSRFEEDFLPVETLRLEQNYRSTKTILDAANAIIKSNQNRVEKILKTDNPQGEAIVLFSANDERHEAIFVMQQIQQLIEEKNYTYKDFAILYRSNAQSRVFEETLIRGQMPYRIYGGMRFFERAEIKNLLAYLRLIVSRDDDAAFERIVNFPVRGIGATTIARLRDIARESKISLWRVSQQVVQTQALAARTTQALNNFLTLIDQLAENIKNLPLVEQAQMVLEATQLLKYYKKDANTAVGLSRVENLEEFINAVSQFESPKTDVDVTTSFSALSEFLSHIALDAGDMQSENKSDNSINLMTLHSTKGLEFPIVFLVGLEEGLFPHYLSKDNPAQLEEERRLCYVGITRAKSKLYLTCAETRYLQGRMVYNASSRFLEEIPTPLLQDLRPKVTVQQTIASNKRPFGKKRQASKQTNQLSSEFSIGQKVRHKKFGVGIIIGGEGDDEALRLQIKFERAGTKWLVASFAKLEVFL
jgi:DNA helicase-2/ATP-dependent DNA helicase PcrA